MTDQELTAMLVLLDSIWGGVDEVRAVGYRWVLSDRDGELVTDAIRQLATEDRPWLPKPPEIAARVQTLERKQRQEQRLMQRVRQLEEKPLDGGRRELPALPSTALTDLEDPEESEALREWVDRTALPHA